MRKEVNMEEAEVVYILREYDFLPVHKVCRLLFYLIYFSSLLAVSVLLCVIGNIEYYQTRQLVHVHGCYKRRGGLCCASTRL